MSVLPFDQTQVKENIFVRKFSKYVDSEDLVWHRDHRDRTVEVLSGKGWSIQLDNKVPQTLTEGSTFFIKSGEYHRLIKGDSNLIIKISERK